MKFSAVVLFTLFASAAAQGAPKRSLSEHRGGAGGMASNDQSMQERRLQKANANAELRRRMQEERKKGL